MRRRGFSLIELIVVIGIIAVLIAMLLPTLSIARDHARRTKCAAQLHGLGQAFANYAVAFKGSYPQCALWERYGGDGTSGDDSPEPSWVELLEPYYAKVSSGVYHCPAFEDPTLINYYIETKWLSKQDRLDLRTSDIAISSQFILSGDVSNSLCYPPPTGLNYKHETDDCDKDSASLNNLAFAGEDYGKNIHRSGNNVLFGDYHVSTYRKFEPGEMSFHPKKPGINWKDTGKAPD